MMFASDSGQTFSVRSMNIPVFLAEALTESK